MAKKKATSTPLRPWDQATLDAAIHTTIGRNLILRAVNNEARTVLAMRAALNTLKDEYPRNTWQDYPAIAMLTEALRAAGDQP